MQLKISRMCMFLTTVKENWEASHQMYSKVQDVTQIYELKTKMNTTKQATLSIFLISKGYSFKRQNATKYTGSIQGS